MPDRPIYLTGIGTYVPDVVPVADAVAAGRYPADEVAQQGLLGAAVAGDLPPPEMALLAARAALKQHGGPAEDLCLLLYVSVWHQGPDGWLPHHHLQRQLVGGRALALEIRQGCNGAFTALELAAAHLRAADGSRSALIVTAENFGTPLIDRWRAAPNLILADGAGAVVLSTEPGFAQLLGVRSITVTEAEELHRAGEPMFPPSVTRGRPLDFAGRTAAFIAANDAGDDPLGVWLRINQALVDAAYDVVGAAGIAMREITRVAFTNLDHDSVHDRCMAALGIPMSRSTWNYGRTVGHLAAGDQVVSLARLVETGQVGPGDHVLLAGVGPGVTASCALVRILDRPGTTS